MTKLPGFKYGLLRAVANTLIEKFPDAKSNTGPIIIELLDERDTLDTLVKSLERELQSYRFLLEAAKNQLQLMPNHTVASMQVALNKIKLATNAH